MPMLGVVPTFDGLPMFGPAPVVRAWANPVARQVRGFLGTNGLVTKAGGTRGATGEAFGVLFAGNQALLDAAVAVLESYKVSGVASVLVDGKGRAWPAMILVDFRLASEIRQDNNAVSIEYRAEFLGLVQPF
jgi:hypothetical protein